MISKMKNEKIPLKNEDDLKRITKDISIPISGPGGLTRTLCNVRVKEVIIILFTQKTKKKVHFPILFGKISPSIK